MKHEILFNLLLEQVENLKELLFAVKLQQECLVKNNRETLDQTIKTASVLFPKVDKLQNKVIEEIKKIDAEEKLGLKEFRVTELIKYYSAQDEDTAKKLSLLKKHIVTYTKEISRINFHNSFLIDQSRQLIRDFISSIAGNKKTIFDRRG